MKNRFYVSRKSPNAYYFHVRERGEKTWSLKPTALCPSHEDAQLVADALNAYAETHTRLTPAGDAVNPLANVAQLRGLMPGPVSVHMALPDVERSAREIIA